MPTGLVKPLLITMLLVAAGSARASSLLELSNGENDVSRSTVVMPEHVPQTTGGADPDLSPSMIGIGSSPPPVLPTTKETTRAIPHAPHAPHALPTVIRGGETGAARPGPASPARRSQPKAATAPEREAQPAPEKRSESTREANRPAVPPPPPTGEPVGQPE